MPKAYTLYNKQNDRRLIHPKVGLWFTYDYEEAKDMLKACQEYLKADGLQDFNDDFVIIDIESNEEQLH